ncbi:unnamed protein product [Spirodela intermedia]|uniref:Uncharacterized protein n=1 Tax=Spirodela intermedia TaxID=51605 RepID=A0A7I8JYY3_SPIIN|nr:unnamed protein product [Spirodela intermedia]
MASERGGVCVNGVIRISVARDADHDEKIKGQGGRRTRRCHSVRIIKICNLRLGLSSSMGNDLDFFGAKL